MLRVLKVGTGKYGRLIVQNVFWDGRTDGQGSWTLQYAGTWPWPPPDRRWEGQILSMLRSHVVTVNVKSLPVAVPARRALRQYVLRGAVPPVAPHIMVLMHTVNTNLCLVVSQPSV
jgi:hypothetical protein